MLPLYDLKHQDGTGVARQLATGLILRPVDESGAEEERGQIQLQHPSGEAWEAEGRMVATGAIRDYVDLMGFGLTETSRRAEFRRMCDHFAFKTGTHVYIEWENDASDALALAGRVVRALGKDVAMSAFKKLLGLP
ncbi:hypothetical protein [Luteibacter yeojuensis]|uniref:hypothetical protein n=1 Tax=Luteibacter yeojuensis TaxID=345309 RepID=UPI0012EE3116|nr:hypothetical protein [Luteibacter yeojuensis]